MENLGTSVAGASNAERGWIREEAEGALLRRAGAVAIGLHVVLFGLQLPETERPLLAEAEKAEVLVIQTPRFRRPADPPQKILEPRARRVPIPDATPDDPEPLRPMAIEEPEMEPPELGFLGEIPPAPPPPAAGPILVSGEVRPPVKLFAPQPAYTEHARLARIEGSVIVRAVIDTEGRVRDLKVLESLPMGLDDSTTQTMATWRFEPATLRGRPVSVYYTLTVRFSLS